MLSPCAELGGDDRNSCAVSLVLEFLQRLGQLLPGDFGLVRLDGGRHSLATAKTPERPSISRLRPEQDAAELLGCLEQTLCFMLGDIHLITHGQSLTAAAPLGGQLRWVAATCGLPVGHDDVCEDPPTGDERSDVDSVDKADDAASADRVLSTCRKSSYRTSRPPTIRKLSHDTLTMRSTMPARTAPPSCRPSAWAPIHATVRARCSPLTADNGSVPQPRNE